MNVEPNKYFENLRPPAKHCLRRNGTERAWFVTRQEAEQFAASPANPAYRGDITHLCAHCDHYHLSKPSWLEPQFTQADYQMLEAAGIENAPRALCCDVCGSVQQDGEEFFILKSGALRCFKCANA
jgi:hypothetical protein